MIINLSFIYLDIYNRNGFIKVSKFALTPLFLKILCFKIYNKNMNITDLK